ncbi:hypothetical protein ACJMK2_030988 [Sinanodonta woodiana]|uniref:Uncharacterized protein n=1 Tax=Sinanodonta woodiana TaxID=1069815 RepID=A0ABD3WXF2_SINWO
MSVDKKGQIEYDVKVREPTPGYRRMDTAQYGNHAQFSSKPRDSSIVAQTYPVNDSKYRVHSETPSTRGESPVSKNDMSLDKKSQIEHDEKVRESSSGSGRKNTTQYGNDAPFSSKSRYSPILVQKYPVHESKYRVHSETPSTRGESPVSKNDMSLDKKSEIEYDEKVRESFSGSGRKNTTQYGNDAPFLSKSRDSSIVVQNYPVNDSKYRVHSETPSTRGESPVSKNDMSLDKRSQIEHD